ncbi:hypothetical protein [Roseateles microcysteis]|uniref:hypothetical protein n=1 Tax=Roseateles microcysteis TaxID=3119057 RepID=UPI002FE6BE40
MDGENTSGSWSDWVQNIAGNAISKAVEAKWVQPYETEQMRLKALGQTGSYYAEGQRNGVPQGTVAGMNPKTMLLIGGAGLVLVLLLAKR